MTTTRDLPASADGVRLVVRVWLPDRPGALGRGRTTIGAIGADIVGVDVLERSDQVAVDEFAVVIKHGPRRVARPGDQEVDGVSVEAWKCVDRFPDPRLDFVRMVEGLRRRHCRLLWRPLVSENVAEFGADWAIVARPSRRATPAHDSGAWSRSAWDRTGASPAS